MLAADLNAAKAHLELAQLPHRTQQQFQVDVEKARDLFIRASGQAPEDDWGRILKAPTQKDIALCSAMLGDHVAAQHFASTCSQLIDELLIALTTEKGYHNSTLSIARNVAREPVNILAYL